MSSVLHRTHMDTCKLMHEMSMCFHSTLDTTFRCLLLLLSKNNSRRLLRYIKHTRAHLHTAPNLRLMLINLTSSEWCVRLRRPLFMQKAKSWNCVIAPSCKHITGPQQGCVQVSVTGWFTCLPCPPLTSSRLPFHFLPYLFFCLSSSAWTL